MRLPGDVNRRYENYIRDAKKKGWNFSQNAHYIQLLEEFLKSKGYGSDSIE